MKHLFKAEFFDGLELIYTANSVQDVVEQVKARMDYFDKSNEQLNKQIDWRIRSIKYIKEIP